MNIYGEYNCHYLYVSVDIDHGTFNKTFYSNDFLLRASYCIIFYVLLDLIHPIIIYKSLCCKIKCQFLSYNQEKMSHQFLK